MKWNLKPVPAVCLLSGILCGAEMAGLPRDFSVSGGQGCKNWYYLYFPGKVEQYDFNRTAFLQNRRNEEWWRDNQDPSQFPKISRKVMVPGLKAPLVCRYLAPESSSAAITVKLQKMYDRGDGVSFRTFLNGKELGKATELKDTQEKEVRLTVELMQGDSLDFVLDGGRSPVFDHTWYKIVIEKE